MIIDGYNPSWGKRMLDDVLWIDRLYAVSSHPTDEQRKLSKNMSFSECKELSAFVQDNEDRIKSLLAAKTPQEFQELQREYVMEFRNRETHFSRIREIRKDINGIVTDEHYRVSRREKPPEETYNCETINYFISPFKERKESPC